MRLVFIVLALVPSLAFADDVADAHNTLAEAKSARGYGKYHLEKGEWDDATKYTKKCVDQLDAFFKAHPEFQKRSFEYSGEQLSYKDMRDSCTKQLGDITKSQKQAEAEALADGQKRLKEAVELNYKRAVDQLAEARKEVTAGAYSDAMHDFEGAISGFGSIKDQFAEILEKVPTLKTFEVTPGGKKKAASALLDEMTKTVADLIKERESIKEKAIKQEDAADEQLAKMLKGGRKQVYNDRGFPSWYEGANFLVMAARNKALLTSPYWRYSMSDGCETIYRFRGDKLVKTEHNHAGCE